MNPESVFLEDQSPYQRIYQNASKRFKKDDQDVIMADVANEEG